MKKYILWVSLFCMLFLSGCSGFSCLPDMNFVGKNREEVIRIFASCPEKSPDGKINLMVSVNPHNPLNCNVNLYFRTPDEAIADERIQNSCVIGGYKTERRFSIPGGWNYYEVIFDRNHIAVSQKIVTQFDGP